MNAHIAHVRRFNRLISQRAGALDHSYLGRGRPLGEARVLFEIGYGGSDARALRDRLDLDSGYLSRLLRSLEKQGMIVVSPSPQDRRVRTLALTLAGQAEVAAYDRLSDEVARAFLTPLTTTQRERLTAAMAEIEQLLSVPELTISIEAPDNTDAIVCVDLYFRELNARFEVPYEPDKAGPSDIDAFRPPEGIFLLARRGSEVIGCGGLKRLSGDVAEIKRLWVSPEARGLGAGRRLMQALEDQARQSGYSKVRLDTNRALTEAQALYEALGYAQTPPYNDNPYADYWFGKDL